MRYTRVDVEGEAGLFASITRKRNDPVIEIEIIAPEGETAMRVGADDRDGQWSAAESLQARLDGRPGGRSDVRDYFTAIELLGS